MLKFGVGIIAVLMLLLGLQTLQVKAVRHSLELKTAELEIRTIEYNAALQALEDEKLAMDTLLSRYTLLEAQLDRAAMEYSKLISILRNKDKYTQSISAALKDAEEEAKFKECKVEALEDGTTEVTRVYECPPMESFVKVRNRIVEDFNAGK